MKEQSQASSSFQCKENSQEITSLLFSNKKVKKSCWSRWSATHKTVLICDSLALSKTPAKPAQPQTLGKYTA